MTKELKTSDFRHYNALAYAMLTCCYNGIFQFNINGILFDFQPFYGEVNILLPDGRVTGLHIDRTHILVMGATEKIIAMCSMVAEILAKDSNNEWMVG